MTESSKPLDWQNCRVDPQDLKDQISSSEDRLPVIHCDGVAGTLLVTPEIAFQYRQLQAGRTEQTPKHYDLKLLVPNPSQTLLTTSDIVALMKANGGHLIKVEDLARLYPNAHLVVTSGKNLGDLNRESLGKAFIDPSGELIVSHLYQKELFKNAPAFSQFMTNSLKPGGDPDCHRPDLAFKKKSCAPDSWPVDSDTLLSLGSLSVNLKSDQPWTKALSDLKSGLTGVTQKSHYLLINLSNPKPLLASLSEKVPSLHCNPDNPEDMAYHLGIPSATLPKPLNETIWRRALFAILDDPSTALFYQEDQVNHPAPYKNPAEINKKAGKPSLYFVARISPENTSQVIFGIYHIDAQSYHPRGWLYGREILGPDQHDPQHQGEVEPLYLLFDRPKSSSGLTLKKAYLGDHFIAEPVEARDYTGELAVAYGSGGRILLPDRTSFLPGAMFRTGRRSKPAASIGTLTHIFPYIEVYPGRKDLSGPNPIAARYEPETGYRVILEGENGDFIPTGRILSKNGKAGSDELNRGGYPFLRGADEDGHEKSRTSVRLYDFLKRQDKFHEERLMGGLSLLTFQMGFPDSGRSFSLKHEVSGLNYVQSWAFDIYFFNPLDLYFFPSLPQFGASIFSTQPERFRLDWDQLTVRGGPMKWGFQLFGEFGAGYHVSGNFQNTASVHPGLFFEAGGFLGFHRFFLEPRVGWQVYCSTSDSCYQNWYIGLAGQIRRD